MRAWPTGLLFVCLITWNVLTARWFLIARSDTTPTPWFRELVTTLPVWAKILLTVGSAPIVFGVLAIFYRNGVNILVLIGGLVGLVMVLRFYRRHAQGSARGAKLRGQPRREIAQELAARLRRGPM